MAGLKYVAPSVGELAFNCPHCGALAKQFWYQIQATNLKSDEKPKIVDRIEIKRLETLEFKDEKGKDLLLKWAHKMEIGRPFLEDHQVSSRFTLYNLSLARCFNCADVSIWIHDRLTWPAKGVAPIPNADLPPEVQRDYEEAGIILDASPRGSAALLRLAVQKICQHLGGSGKNIDSDIAALVKKGLDVRVRQALDIVRVIGNNAVHPGQIDLRDDRSTAEKLFGLVNLIAEIMISQPKHIAAMYSNLPESARVAIDKRDNG